MAYDDLPGWGHPLGELICPIVIVKDGYVEPVGTAFCISPIGIFMTAQHVIDEHYKHLMPSRPLSELGENRINSILGRTISSPRKPLDGYIVTYLPNEERNNYFVALGVPGRAMSVEPTDIGLLAIKFILPERFSNHSWTSIPLSPLIPKIGDKVKCMGHCLYDNNIQNMSIEDFNRLMSIEIADSYPHTLRVSEGEVTEVYTQKYSSGFGEGPCFRISCSLEHGQSGGPVINSDGYACGINMGSQFEGEDSCLASCLWPALGQEFIIPETMRAKVSGHSHVSLKHLIDNNLIGIDDSLKDCAIHRDADGVMTILPIAAVIHRYQDEGLTLPKEIKINEHLAANIYRDYKDSS